MSQTRTLIVTFAEKYRLSLTKPIFRLATFTLLFLAITGQSFAAPKNLVAGVGPLKSATKWDDRTAISVIPGASLFPTSSKTTALYIAFTGGTQAEVGNMVLYQTGARNSIIATVTPITLNGVSNPTINLQDTAICPDQPVSETAPCIIRLDQLTLQLAAASDYYLAIHFTSPSSNNANLSLSKPQFSTSGLTGFIGFGDETNLVVGDSLNTLVNAGTPFGLIAVMSK
jgi:hypothetical protein